MHRKNMATVREVPVTSNDLHAANSAMSVFVDGEDQLRGVAGSDRWAKLFRTVSV